MDVQTSTETHYGKRPLIGLLSDLWRDSTTLIRGEIELAKTELVEKASTAGIGIAALAIGGAVCFAGFLFVLLAGVGGLAQALPEEVAPWLAPLIVGVIVLLPGALMLVIGWNKIKAGNLTTSRLAESVRQDAQVIKEHLK